MVAGARSPARWAMGMNRPIRSEIAVMTRRKTTIRSSSVPVAADGSSYPQWKRSPSPGKTGHDWRALSHTVIT